MARKATELGVEGLIERYGAEVESGPSRMRDLVYSMMARELSGKGSRPLYDGFLAVVPADGRGEIFYDPVNGQIVEIDGELGSLEFRLLRLSGPTAERLEDVLTGAQFGAELHDVEQDAERHATYLHIIAAADREYEAAEKRA